MKNVSELPDGTEYYVVLSIRARGLTDKVSSRFLQEQLDAWLHAKDKIAGIVQAHQKKIQAVGVSCAFETSPFRTGQERNPEIRLFCLEIALKLAFPQDSIVSFSQLHALTGEVSAEVLLDKDYEGKRYTLCFEAEPIKVCPLTPADVFKEAYERIMTKLQEELINAKEKTPQFL